jgi:hypothetical protein
MPDTRLLQPLQAQTQTPRDILPKEWADSLKLDYLNSNEQVAELAERLTLISQAVFDLQAAVEALQNAP